MIIWDYIRGWARVKLQKRCPHCRNEDPLVYACPVCKWYCGRTHDQPWPPRPQLLAEWWTKYKDYLANRQGPSY